MCLRRGNPYFGSNYDEYVMHLQFFGQNMKLAIKKSQTDGQGIQEAGLASIVEHEFIL